MMKLAVALLAAAGSVAAAEPTQKELETRAADLEKSSTSRTAFSTTRR